MAVSPNWGPYPNAKCPHDKSPTSLNRSSGPPTYMETPMFVLPAAEDPTLLIAASRRAIACLVHHGVLTEHSRHGIWAFPKMGGPMLGSLGEGSQYFELFGVHVLGGPDF